MVQFQKYVWEVIGWIGALFALLAFSLNSFNFLDSQSVYIWECIALAVY